MAVSELPFALAFGAGLVAAVNPCGFAMLPAFISYYLGTETGPASAARAGRAAEGLLVGLVLASGFMAVFGAVGVVFSLGARAIVKVVPWATIGIGAGLVVLGGWLLAGRYVTLRIPGMRVREKQRRGYRSIFAFGIAYAVGSLSCTLPVFLVVVGGGLAAGSALGTLAVFLAYGLGIATILMVLSLATAGFREVLVRRIRRVLPYVSRISGGLLIVGGAYIVYYWGSILAGAQQSAPVRVVQRLQQRVQDLVARPGQAVWVVVGLAMVMLAVVYLVRRPARVRKRQPASDAEPEPVELKP